MAQITGQQGAQLSNELAQYLNAASGTLTSEELQRIINTYLSGGDKLGAQGSATTTGIFKRFSDLDKVTGKIEVVTTGMWTGDSGSLTSFYTSSTQVAATSGDYYYNIYQTDPSSDSSAPVQFAVAYGHKEGSGSVSLANDDDATLPTKATYAQYRSLLLDQDDNQFTFVSSSDAGTHDSDDIYVINVARARYKEKMDPGNISIKISGSNGEFTFVDDSGKKFSDTVGKAGRIFNIVSGSLNLGTQDEATVNTTTASNGEGYGLFYPDQGLVLLNPSALSDTIGSELAPTLTVTANEQNQEKLYNALKLGADFEARRTENVSTSHYFVRATNREFNFSNNPTFSSGSDGSFTESSFESDPKTFVTTVGLYNDASEMLAVAKLSQPARKSFDREVLIRVKLSF